MIFSLLLKSADSSAMLFNCDAVEETILAAEYILPTVYRHTSPKILECYSFYSLTNTLDDIINDKGWDVKETLVLIRGRAQVCPILRICLK